MNLAAVISTMSLALSLFALFVTYNVTVATQRAFVFIKDFQIYSLRDAIVIIPRWQNTGSTPTRGMVNYANWKFFEGRDIPNDFAFPDLDATGNPIGNRDQVTTPMFIGPKGEAFSETLRIPVQIFERARAGEGRIYIWGWTTYQDVFWLSGEHRTKYCNEVQVTGLEVNADTRQVIAGVSFRLHRKHNCIDGDCK